MDTLKPEYYVLTPIYPPEPNEFRIANASVGMCGLCGGVATGMGGSQHDVCLRCAEVVIAQQAIGCIKWEEDGNAN